MRTAKYIIVALMVLLWVNVTAQKSNVSKEYKLENGLTVILMEDKTARDVRGVVSVRAGTADEEEGKTGAATLLKHLMDNGTDKIGALDWEQERPLLDEISRLYDSLAMAKGTMRRAELNRRISEMSAAAAQYGSPMEYGRLMRRIGATDAGSEVTRDGSMYWSSFPKESVEKWLELNSERFINPVFRKFQGVLNVVCAEYNRETSALMPFKNIGSKSQMKVSNSADQPYIDSKLYKGTPYARPFMGNAEDLERLSPRTVEEYYEKWYVANNMALILAGNFDAEEVKPMLETSFGRIKTGALPTREQYPAPDFSDGKRYTTGTTGWHYFYWNFKGVGRDNPDYVPLDFTLNLLTNSHGTGLLDRLNHEMTTSRIGAANRCYNRVEDGVLCISMRPMVSRYETSVQYLKDIEKTLFEEIDKLKDPKTIPEELFMAAKRTYINEQEMSEMLTNGERALRAGEAFVLGMEMSGMSKVKRARGLTKADVARCANRYLSGGYQTIVCDCTLPAIMPEKTEMQEIGSVEWPDAGESAYATRLMAEEVRLPEAEYGVRDSVTVRQLDNGAFVHYSQNRENNNFNLTLRYDYGTRDDPWMEYAVWFLDRSGIMPDKDETERRRMFYALGSTVEFRVDESHFYIELSGDDKYLNQTLGLVSAMIYTPKFVPEHKHLLVNEMVGNRFVEWRSEPFNYDALEEYVRYRDKSMYIDRPPKDRLIFYNGLPNIPYVFESDGIFMAYVTDYLDMWGVIRTALGSTAEAYYYGSLPLGKAVRVLESMPRNSVVPSRAVGKKRLTEYETTRVVFFPKGDMAESRVFLYVNTGVPDTRTQVRCHAFNLYFSDLLAEEFRLDRAMSNVPAGAVEMPAYIGGGTYFHGEIETGHEEVNDVLDAYMELLEEMPEHQERFEGVVRTLRSSYLKRDPDMRRQAMSYEVYRRAYPEGFPLKEWLSELERLTFDDMMEYYESHIKGKPVTIAIMGDPARIGLKHLREKYGKVRWISRDKLFVDDLNIM